jgi:glucosylceramidase
MTLHPFKMLIILLPIAMVNCHDRNSNTQIVERWITSKDQSKLLFCDTIEGFKYQDIDSSKTIFIDENETYQTIDGFGFTLTGGSAKLIQQLDTETKKLVLEKLFSTKGIAISFLRISIGASDLDEYPYTYNDIPKGSTDVELNQFSLKESTNYLIPLLKEIMAINPRLKILATPWSAPVWMKDNKSFIGGTLMREYMMIYAQYLITFIEAMQAEGINIYAITPQNEPLHDGNNPSMYMSWEQQNEFIKNYLGPVIKKENLDTKIIIYDHNCDNIAYPILILEDTLARKYIWGSAFHLYAGEIAELAKVHQAHPDKHIYFTEQYTGKDGDFGGDLQWHLKNVVIGSLRNWSKSVFQWNLANDENFGPHTIGGCTSCKGAITLNGSPEYNVGFYIIGQISKFIPPNSIRIKSNLLPNIHNVVFKTSEGKLVMVAINLAEKTEVFMVNQNGKQLYTSLEGGSVATYVW